ncbi:MAG: geranylgeranylglyceryl/heptaprenylglyceryl phosphate synthase, partial [Thermoprotei archaeon]
PVPPEVVSAVSRSLENAYVIVGGGIREPEVALKMCESGANIIVTGNIIEDRLDKALKIIEAIKRK